MLSDFSRLNRRMHNKSLTADSVASIVGGRNVGNEYFSFESNVEFGDFDLLLYGNTVTDTADQFDRYWNNQHAIPIDFIHPSDKALSLQTMRNWFEDSRLQTLFSQGRYDFRQLDFYQKLFDNSLPLNWGRAQLWVDDPNKVLHHSSELITLLQNELAQFEHSLMIISPYFVPTERGTQWLVDAAQQGKKITIVTNSLASNDVFAVHGWYAKYRQALLSAGIELWETKANAQTQNQWSVSGSSRSSLHAKIMLFDQRKLLVGSMNFDPRSASLNTEMAVMIEHPDYTAMSVDKVMGYLPSIAYQLHLVDNEVQWHDLKDGDVFTSEPQASIWRKIGAWFSGLLPIESQL